jgi:ArsR family transcriptional regulator, virulence genes transcriptional regulator
MSKHFNVGMFLETWYQTNMLKIEDPMEAAANEAAEVLKALANPRRLRILCALVQGEMSVGELEAALGSTQSYVSGQLLKLRNEGLVACEKDGRIVRYRLSDPRVKPVLERLYEVFCPEQVVD